MEWWHPDEARDEIAALDPDIALAARDHLEAGNAGQVRKQADVGGDEVDLRPGAHGASTGDPPMTWS